MSYVNLSISFNSVLMIHMSIISIKLTVNDSILIWFFFFHKMKSVDSIKYKCVDLVSDDGYRKLQWWNEIKQDI